MGVENINNNKYAPARELKKDLLNQAKTKEEKNKASKLEIKTIDAVLKFCDLNGNKDGQYDKTEIEEAERLLRSNLKITYLEPKNMLETEYVGPGIYEKRVYDLNPKPALNFDEFKNILESGIKTIKDSMNSREIVSTEEQLLSLTVSKEAIPDVLRLLQTEKDPYTRAIIFNIIGRIGNNTIDTGKIIPHNSANRDIWTSVMSFAVFGDNEKAENILGEFHKQAADNAIKTLITFKDTESLRLLSNDADKYVRNAAKKALNP